MNVGSSTSTVSSGSYTPTVANVSNTSSLTASISYYTVVGNIVTVGFAVNGNVTANSQGIFSFTIPTGANFSSTSQGWGSAASQISTTVLPATVVGSNGTQTALVTWQQPAGVTTFSFAGTFTYQKQ